MAPPQVRAPPAASKQRGDTDKAAKQEGAGDDNKTVKKPTYKVNTMPKSLPKIQIKRELKPGDGPYPNPPGRPGEYDDTGFRYEHPSLKTTTAIETRPNSYATQIQKLGKKMAKAASPLPAAKGTHNIERYLQEKGIGPIAKYMMLPGEAEMIDIPRFNSAIGGREMAVANPKERIPASFDPATGTSVAFKFRDPYRSFVYSIQIQNGSQYTYQSDYFALTTGPVENHLPGVPLRYTTGGQPIHGESLFPGADDSRERYYWWCNEGDLFELQLQAPLTGNFSTVEVYRWGDSFGNDAEPVGTSITNFGVGTTIITTPILTSGYYTYTMFSPLTAMVGFSGTYRVRITRNYLSPVMGWGHRGSPNIESNFQAALDIRHVAASLMYSNTSAVLSRDGYAIAKQMQEDVLWTEVAGALGSDPMSVIAQYRDIFSTELVEGIYGYLRPVDFKDFELFAAQSTFVNSVSTINCASFQLNNDSEYLAIVVSAATGRQGYWTLVDGLEYSTNDQWRNTHISLARPAAWGEALAVCSRADQWHTNKMHIKDIADFVHKAIKRTAQFVLDYGPTAAKVAAAFV